MELQELDPAPQDYLSLLCSGIYAMEVTGVSSPDTQHVPYSQTFMPIKTSPSAFNLQIAGKASEDESISAPTPSAIATGRSSLAGPGMQKSEPQQSPSESTPQLLTKGNKVSRLSRLRVSLRSGDFRAVLV